MGLFERYLTLWVALAGFKLISGTSREPALSLLAQGAKIVLVMSLIVGLTKNTDTVIHKIYDLRNDITAIITNSDADITQLIDTNMAITQIISLITEDLNNAHSVARGGSASAWMAIAGQSGPPILTSILVMISEVAIAISMMLAPLFLFFLLFKPTAQMFWGWLKFLVATFVTMAFLCIVAEIAMEGTLRYGLVLALSSMLNVLADDNTSAAMQLGAEIALGVITGGGTRADIGSGAMRLGAMGGMFSVLIIAVPPVVMQLFGSAMGYAQSILSGIYSPMAGMAAARAGGQQAAMGAQGADGANGGNGHSYAPPQLNNASSHGQNGQGQGSSAETGTDMAKQTAREAYTGSFKRAFGIGTETSSAGAAGNQYSLAGPGNASEIMNNLRVAGGSGLGMQASSRMGMGMGMASTATTPYGSSATTYGGATTPVSYELTSNQSSASTLRSANQQLASQQVASLGNSSPSYVGYGEVWSNGSDVRGTPGDVVDVPVKSEQAGPRARPQPPRSFRV